MVVPGGVVEWLMAPVLKTGEVKASVGSNPTPSASTQVSVFVREADSRRDCSIFRLKGQPLN